MSMQDKGTTHMTQYLFVIFLSLAPLVHSAAINFNPYNIAISTTEWRAYKGEKYNLVSYEEKEIFYVLPRFMPYVNCLIHQAKEEKAQVSLIDPGIIFFRDIDTLKSNLITRTKNSPKHYVLPPEQIDVYTVQATFQRKKYFLCTKNEGAGIKITKDEWMAVKLVRKSAEAQKHWVEITIKDNSDGTALSYAFATTPKDSHL
jgi:hypothetical protein